MLILVFVANKGLVLSPKNCTLLRILAVISEGVGGFKKNSQEHNINVSRGRSTRLWGEGGIFHNIT